MTQPARRTAATRTAPSALAFSSPAALRLYSLAWAQRDAEQAEGEEPKFNQPGYAAPEDSGDAPVLTQSDDGWELDGEVYAKRSEAFVALEQTEWFKSALARKAESMPEGLGAPRWVDAAAVEPMKAAADKSQVTEERIDQMVRNLAGEATPIPIDGGNVSEVHESAWNSAAPAAGWGLVAIKAIHKNGRPHLWLFGAYLPGVDEQIDAKHLQFGSICFFPKDTHRYTGEAIGARLVSYALTNTPFIDGLTPHAARTAAEPGAVVLVVSRSRKIMATKQKPAAKSAPKKTDNAAPPAERGPMKDALSALAQMLGLTRDENESDSAFTWKVQDAVAALGRGAEGEALTEAAANITAAAGGAPAGDKLAEDAAKSAGDAAAKSVEVAPVKAEGGAPVEGQGQADSDAALANDLMAQLRRAFGLPDANGATLLEMLRQIGEGDLAAEAPEVDENAGADGVPAKSRATAELAGLRTRLTEIEATTKSQAERLAGYEKRERELDLASYLDGRLAAAKKSMPPKDREALLAEATDRPTVEAGKRVLDLACRAANIPPQQIVTPPKPGATAPVGSEPSNEREALRIAKAEVRAAHPNLDEMELVTRSQRIAAQRWRHLFDPNQRDAREAAEG